MKTKELKSLLEKIDYSVRCTEKTVVIEDKFEIAIATIRRDATCQFSTLSLAWGSIPYIRQRLILSYIVEYAETPLKEREEVKKFYLRHRWFKCTNGDGRYFQIYESDGTPWLNAMYTVKGYKKQFTLKEIEEIKKKFDTDLADFEIVEVEE